MGVLRYCLRNLFTYIENKMLKNKIQGIRVKFECIYDVYYHILKSKKWKIRLSTVKHNDLPTIFNRVGELPVSEIIWWHLPKFILMSAHKYWFAAFETVFKWYSQTEVSDRHCTMNTERRMLSLKDTMSRGELSQHSQGVHYYFSHILCLASSWSSLEPNL